MTELALALRRRGHIVTLTSQRQLVFEAQRTAELLAAGVHLVAPPRIRGASSSNLVVSRAYLASVLPKGGFTVVMGFGHGGAFGWMKRFLGTDRGAQLIWNEVWDGLPTRGDRYLGGYTAPVPQEFHRTMRRMAQRVSGIITGCHRAVQNLRAVQQIHCPIAVLPPLVTSEAPDFAVDRVYGPDATITVGMVARHGFGKGTDILARVWPEVRAVAGPARLFLLGPIESAGTRQLVEELSSWDSSVKVYGAFSSSNRQHLLASLDLGLMLSIEEGYGLVLLEYLRSGIPFLTTDAGAGPDLAAQNPDAMCVSVSEKSVRTGLIEMIRRVRAGRTSRIRQQARYYQLHHNDTAIDGYVQCVEAGLDSIAVPR